MTVRLVVVTVRTSTVYVPIKEFEAVRNRDETVEIFCVQCKDIGTICNVVASGSNAVVMLHLTIDAFVVWTRLTAFIFLKTVGNRRTRPGQFRLSMNLFLGHLHLWNDWNVVLWEFRRSATFALEAVERRRWTESSRFTADAFVEFVMFKTTEDGILR